MYKYIESLGQAGLFLDDLLASTELGLDLETSGLDPIIDTIYLLQVNISGKIYIFDWRKLGEKSASQLIALIRSQNKKVVGHNLKFDLSFLYEKTGYLLTNVYDTMLVEVILNRGVGDSFYSLADLVYKYCNVVLEKDTRKEFYSSEKSIDSFTEQQLIYSALDVKYLFDIKKAQEKKVLATKQAYVVELESELLPVVTSMERTGIYLDEPSWRYLMKLAQEKLPFIDGKIKTAVAERLNFSKYNNLLELSDALAIPVKAKRDRAALEMITDREFYKAYIDANLNLSSHKQLLTVLNAIGIKTDSTGEKVLRELPTKDDVILEILNYREYDKKATSFGESFLNKINPKTKRIHYNLNQLGAVTGRFSCDSPNMQQIVRGSDYRECFAPSKGNKYITVDFSQQELRITGSVTQEPRFIQAYNENADLHAITASLLFNKKISDITKRERDVGKGFNFAIVYGSTPRGLAYNFNMPLQEAESLLNNFTAGYPVLAEFKRQFEDFVITNKYTFTLTGRRRYFNIPDLFQSAEEYRKIISSTKREGFNTLIQGTGADITKISLNNIFYNNPFGDKLKLVLVVHDEILSECRESIADEALEFVKQQMLMAEQTYLENIPAAVDGKVGDAWGH